MVLALCGQEEMLESSREECTMGVDTGRELHVVIAKRIKNSEKHQIVYIGVHHSYAELDELMKRFNVWLCVIDALPDIHATREFAKRPIPVANRSGKPQECPGSTPGEGGAHIAFSPKGDNEDGSQADLVCIYHYRVQTQLARDVERRSSRLKRNLRVRWEIL